MCAIGANFHCVMWPAQRTPFRLQIDQLCRQRTKEYASISHAIIRKPTSQHKGRKQLKQHADARRPRLLGGDPLTKVRLAERKIMGIPEDRGHEQDNTPKKLRKEKPPRGHPDRKPRHKNNPRRIPDLFRVTRWQQMLYLVHHHHDWLDWKKLTIFLNRTLVLYGRASAAQKTALRESGLLDRMKERTEELDWREAEPETVEHFRKAWQQMEWDPGAATNERMNARLEVVQRVRAYAAEHERRVLQERIVIERQRLRRWQPSTIY